MAAAMQIQLDEASAQEVCELASALDMTPEQAAEQILANGIHMLRRYAFYATSDVHVSAEEGRVILARAGRNNPPDPGDELPEGYTALP